MIRKTLCLIFSLIMIFNIFFVVSAYDESETDLAADGEPGNVMTLSDESSDNGVSLSEVSEDDDTMMTLVSLVRKFPAGKYWNHMGSDVNEPDGITETPCSSHRGCSWIEGYCSCNSFDRAIQCMGYAHKIAYDITGVSPRSGFTKSTTLDANKLRVGDVIRFRNNGHSICVTGVSGTKISFTDCNWDYKCGIRWGVMDISYIKSRGFTYVLHLTGNDRQNTDLYFFDHIEDYEAQYQQEPENAEIWQMSGSNLNVRKSFSVDSSKVGTIPANNKFYVTEKKYTEEYLWGYITYGKTTGWAVLNYSEYISGVYQKPDISEYQTEYSGYNLTFAWNELSGADFYLFRLYDENKKLIKQFNVYGNTTASVCVDADGKYYAKIYSRSSHASSWLLSSALISFEVEKKEEQVEISSIVFDTDTLSLVPDTSFNLGLTVEPAEYTEELIWKSSSEKIVTVDAGKITALSCGDAVISCSDSDGDFVALCNVSVRPAVVTGLKQLSAKTTVSKISFTWDVVGCADGYEIYRYNSSIKKYEKLGSTETNEFTDSSVQAGKSYYYLVRAYDIEGEKSFKGTNTKIRFASRPAKVTGFKQKSSSTGSVTLFWDESENATVYVLYKYNSELKKYEKTKVVTTNSYTVTANPGESAYYRVYAATKVNGIYLYSAVSDKIFTVSGPEKPEITVSSEKEGTALITWDEVNCAYYYYVFRYTSTGGERVALLRSSVTSFEDTGLESGEEYSYRVRAVARKGGVNGYGLYSDKIAVKIK